MQAPPGFYAFVPGASVQLSSDDRIAIQMPAEWTPVRRVVNMAVNRADNYIIIDLQHGAVYDKARNGQHAWQSPNKTYGFKTGYPSFAPEALRSKASRPQNPTNYSGYVRLLEKPMQHIWGNRSATEQLKRHLHKAKTRGPMIEGISPLVRVTPEGFQLIVFLPDHPIMSRNNDWVQRATIQALSIYNDPVNWISLAYKHGSGLAFSPEWERRVSANRLYSDITKERLDRRRPSPFLAQVIPEVRMRIDANSISLANGAITLSNCANQVDYSYQGEEDMPPIDTTTAADVPFALAAGERIVRVVFDNLGLLNKEYAYFASSLELAEGDFVVVASPYANGGAVYDAECGGYLKVVQVASVDENIEGIRNAAKWIISKVDVTDYRARRQRAEDLKLLDAKIERAKKEAMRNLELKKLMELSPELAELISQRDTLTSPQTSTEAQTNV